MGTMIIISSNNLIIANQTSIIPQKIILALMIKITIFNNTNNKKIFFMKILKIFPKNSKKNIPITQKLTNNITTIKVQR